MSVETTELKCPWRNFEDCLRGKCAAYGVVSLTTVENCGGPTEMGCRRENEKNQYGSIYSKMENVENHDMGKNCFADLTPDSIRSCADFFLMVGLGAKFFEHDKMTLEEALDLVDPSVASPPSIDKNLDMFKDIKARGLVVMFAREALKNQKKTDCGEEENHG